MAGKTKKISSTHNPPNARAGVREMDNVELI
jgi:hypothetical protein